MNGSRISPFIHEILDCDVTRTWIIEEIIIVNRVQVVEVDVKELTELLD
jgi:hypothetical protein